MRLIYAVTCLVMLVLMAGYQPNVSANEEENSRSVLDAINNEGTVEHEEDTEKVESNQTNTSDEQQENNPGSSNKELANQSTFMIFLQMIGALAFVIFLLYAILRFVNKKNQAFRSTQLLQNVGGVPLGTNRSVQLIKVGRRVLVVGVGETIQLLKEIENEDEINELMNQRQEQFAQIDLPLNRVKTWFTTRLLGNKASKSNVNPSNKTEQEAFKALLSKQLSEVSHSQKKFQEAVREKEREE